MSEIAQESQRTHQRLIDATQAQLNGLSTQWEGTARQVADTWTSALHSQNQTQQHLPGRGWMARCSLHADLRATRRYRAPVAARRHLAGPGRTGCSRPAAPGRMARHDGHPGDHARRRMAAGRRSDGDPATGRVPGPGSSSAQIREQAAQGGRQLDGGPAQPGPHPRDAGGRPRPSSAGLQRHLRAARPRRAELAQDTASQAQGPSDHRAATPGSPGSRPWMRLRQRWPPNGNVGTQTLDQQQPSARRWRAPLDRSPSAPASTSARPWPA